MRRSCPSLTLSAVARFAGTLLVVGAATACATEDKEEPSAPPTMDAVFEQVLEPRCTFSSCHSAPTVAAKLDLSRERACNALVDTVSCLFPQRKLVVPSSPDDSFLMHKLTGNGLTEAPTGECANQSNAPMPFGGSTIPDDEIALVRRWIAAGAPCEGTLVAPPATGPSAIAGLAADNTAPLAGQMVTFTVTLQQPAPAGGQVVYLQTTSNALSAPVQVFVSAGESQATFDAYAERPTSLFTLVARSGESSQAAPLRVAGLEVAEVLGDAGEGDSQWVKLRNRSARPIELSGYRLQVGQSDYGLVVVPLTGTLAAGACAVIGDPMGPTPNTGSVIYQRLNFTPDLPTTGTQAAGYAVFDPSAAMVGGVRPPVDTMLVGAHNNAQLIAPDGQAAAPACPTPAPGSSARRTGATECGASAPQPTQCD